MAADDFFLGLRFGDLEHAGWDMKLVRCTLCGALLESGWPRGHSPSQVDHVEWHRSQFDGLSALGRFMDTLEETLEAKRELSCG